LISAAHAGGVGEAAAQGISTLSLLDHVADPLVRSGFLNSLADALIMAGRYREAEDVARREISEAERFQLDFVIPNALANVVGAKLGRGKYTAALQALDRVETVDPGGDAFVRTNRVGLRARTYLSMQDYAAAAALEQELDLTARADIVAEVLAVIAFAHALAGSTALATASVERANACRWFTATRIFTAAADLVCVAANGVGAGEKIQDLLSEIVDTGHIDSVVSILRAWPAGSAIFAADARGADLLRHAARVTGDLTLAKASGFATQARTAEISPREREVLELVAQGLRNREVAARLVLSEKTVKTHLQHIYEKLNVSSRTEAVTRARSRGLFD
jgi:ATP/maltotriose-dependent transcriptional regulator MalT